MGSGGSKAFRKAQPPSPSASLGSVDRRERSRGKWVLRPTCLGSPVSDSEKVECDYQAEKHNCSSSRTCPIVTGSGEVNANGQKKVKSRRSSKSPCTDIEPRDRGEASISNGIFQSCTGSREASSAQSSSTRSRFLSHFRFNSGNISSRLSRASSERLGSTISFGDRDEYHLGNEEQSDELAFHLRDSPEEAQRIPPTGEANIDETTMRTGVEFTLCSPRTGNGYAGSSETRFSDRIGAREPSEANVRFSRTLSVGRLRDRVLRRSSLSDFAFCPLQQETEGRDTLAEGHLVASPTVSGHATSSISSLVYGVPDREVETLQSREGRNYDILEHRSNFLERRRRIRSQVRALQRLGSRFENLPGHERSCILSGQNHAGRCTCRLGNRNSHSSNDNNARASISRIVMLAEALFEVLDEIHQQSVVLSSQPSVSSLGSVPAPNDVVNSLPTRSYVKSLKHQNEEATQCYICLVEYDEGDVIRILPCHHEFHRNCVDKWLKEVHRVCPLCRGDICRPESFLEDN